jgi:hypothetical protein
MVHSLYTQREIFLRELISNASDALDRFHFEALRHPGWTTADPEIRIEVDTNPRTVTVYDNGIGMRRGEMDEYLGTIARSMTHTLLGQRRGVAGTDATAPALSFRLWAVSRWLRSATHLSRRISRIFRMGNRCVAIRSLSLPAPDGEKSEW